MVNQLIEAAQAVQNNAYAPYSTYHVGAAVLGANGNIYAGCNVENASYGLTICAERNAVAQMVADGCIGIQAVAVVTENGGSPCGACRQVLSEFGADAAIYLIDAAGSIQETTVAHLLPAAFTPTDLT